MPTAEQIVRALRAMGSARNREGMARFGIKVDNALGVSVTDLRRYAKGLGRDHALALALWDTGVHEARILASIVDEPARVTKAQMNAWARDLDSWDLCDQCCANLFVNTPHAAEQVRAWTARRPEFVKRAGFALIASLAHRKDVGDDLLAGFLPLIEREADDDRNFVRKAVNWALREIGKRNAALNVAAIEAAERIGSRGTKAARWIAADALRELRDPRVKARIRARP